MTTALYVAANEGANIAESMRSVLAYVDRFVVINSIFVSNPAPSTHSTDDQRAEAERIAGDRLTYVESDRKLTETEARNLALSYVEPGERFLIIDGDECLYGDHDGVVLWLNVLDDYTALAIPVYTTAILFNGNADIMSPHEHASNPLISTASEMVRFVQMIEGLHYELPSGHITPMLVLDGSVVLPDASTESAFILNRHATQPFDVYQNDFVWEMGARAP